MGHKSTGFRVSSLNLRILKQLEADGLDLKELRLIASKASDLETLSANQVSLSDLIEFHTDKSWELSRLKTLEFSSCSLSTLDSLHLPEHYPYLESLVLTHNDLETLNGYRFKNLDSLTELDLSDNRVSSLSDPSIFEECRSLKKINLSGNNIHYIHIHSFGGLFNLEELDLSNNSDQLVLFDGLFRDLAKLKRVNLRGNGLRNINLATLFKRTSQLTQLDLSNNQLDNSCINEESFKSLTKHSSLTELNLQNNRLKHIDFVRNLSKLESLDLSGNQIESIYDANGLNLLGRLKSLLRLDLTRNPNMEPFKPDSFAHLQKRCLVLI